MQTSSKIFCIQWITDASPTQVPDIQKRNLYLIEKLQKWTKATKPSIQKTMQCKVYNNFVNGIYQSNCWFCKNIQQNKYI